MQPATVERQKTVPKPVVTEKRKKISDGSSSSSGIRHRAGFYDADDAAGRDVKRELKARYEEESRRGRGMSVTSFSSSTKETTAPTPSLSAVTASTTININRLPLPTALNFSTRVFDDTEYKVASSGDVVILSPASVAAATNFISHRPTSLPSVLTITGPIKSGKTSFLNKVVPGLVVAHQHINGGPRPVFLKHSFTEGAGAKIASTQLLESVHSFGKSLGLDVRGALISPQSESAFVDAICMITNSVQEDGGELWVLLDEMQAPFIAASSADDNLSLFSSLFKTLIDRTFTKCRFVITGSGMVSLLHGIAAVKPNGFRLCEALTPVVLGEEPSSAAAIEMANIIIESRSPQRPALEAAAVMGSLRGQSRADTSPGQWLLAPIPALISYVVDLCVDRACSLEHAVKMASNKVSDESTPDVITALTRMTLLQRLMLRQLAVGTMDAEIGSEDVLVQLLKLVFCRGTSEGGIRLIWPYNIVFASVVTVDGSFDNLPEYLRH